jgi:LAS superfamily LD-carboxypeptidase LdcB
LEEANINLQIVSSYRDFNHQKRIWIRKYNMFTQQGLSPVNAINKIIEYSTIPGTSRHHWGTDIDIIDANAPLPKSLLLPENFSEDGPFCKLKKWMNLNASTFDFHLVYTNNKERKGFLYEPWHFSYTPLSIPYLKKYRKLNIQQLLKEENLIGSENFTQEFIENYITNNVLDINPKLLG